MKTDTGLENNGNNAPALRTSHAATGREGNRTMKRHFSGMRKVKDTAKGELVKIGQSVYIRDEYLREYKRYMLTRWDDISSSRLVKGSRLVEVGFTF